MTKIAAEVIIPHMFTAYAEDLGHRNTGLHHFQYFCEGCGQIFSSAWGRLPQSMHGYERGNYFTCPYCRVKHDKYVAYIERGAPAPDGARLVVKEYKTVVTLEVYSNTLEFNDYLGVYERQYKETFRFDIAKQSVSFTNYRTGIKQESIEIGNPFELDFFLKSILRFFCSNSLANAEQKSELNALLKVLRETVKSKLEKRLKHKVPSMFVSSGTYWGILLIPILNIAYRVACPDAPNLPAEYRGAPLDIRDFWRNKLIKKYRYMDRIMSKTRQKKDFLTALIENHSLPDKPLVRRILTEDPFAIKMLSTSFRLCKNYDHAISTFYGVRKMIDTWRHQDYDGIPKFLRAMKKLYGEAGVNRLVWESSELNMFDCARLYGQLNDENKKSLKEEPVKLRDLHDWMSLQHKRQTHVNVKFTVPDYIVKRLSMQRSRLKFFLPEESMQLLEAGHELHNCVAAYGDNMKDNKLWIVLVADDTGRLAACLGIRGKELIEAKLDRNMPVSSNVKLNSEILDWAKYANIKINTSDVKVTSKKESKEAVPA
ncbi:PcfJ domain-containing protein [Candidatus Contubernalis alkaliaceticus]|uniref:PcfJ domain-containing protein n=1 Tax=Candidatus Contubernalis alkaliaceticus TaxID=338645 RepID=UPI001F4C17A3|nr:PcfJ domain-containing protein [Candidatus Contubernalis alkalaceticus]UNC91678.1 PcfJ domain-containing protein [Candidatus Contubernalis alkalaceticus]